MLNQKFRRVSYKMYLSVQGLVLLIGLGVLIWNIIAAIHDLRIASKGKACVEATIGKIPEWQNMKLDSERWDLSIENYADTVDEVSKKYALEEILEKRCSEYLRVTVYDHSGDVGVYTNNYMGGYPGSISERTGYIGLTIGITLGLMALIFGAMRWLTWLLRD